MSKNEHIFKESIVEKKETIETKSTKSRTEQLFWQSVVEKKNNK